MLKVQIKAAQHTRLQGIILNNMQVVEMQEQVSGHKGQSHHRSQHIADLVTTTTRMGCTLDP